MCDRLSDAVAMVLGVALVYLPNPSGETDPKSSRVWRSYCEFLVNQLLISVDLKMSPRAPK